MLPVILRVSFAVDSAISRNQWLPGQTMFIYEAIAQAFKREGVTAHFSLMGDGNMHWVTAMKNTPGIKTYSIRHEHCACAMAVGYAKATGEVGVASVTHGPGITQVITALGEAAASKTPLVVFIGEVPTGAIFHDQMLDHRQFVVPVGCDYISVRNRDRVMDCVRSAFYTARTERRPVILGVPVDLQRMEFNSTNEYIPSTDFVPKPSLVMPEPERLAEFADMLSKAKAPVILAGMGVVQAGAVQAVVKLADVSQALLGTTLPAKGLFDDHPFSIGVCGGYGPEITREICQGADLLLAVGTTLSYHTLDGGAMFPKATIAQIDLQPKGLHQGLRAANYHLVADARVAAEAITAEIEKIGRTASRVRTPELAKRLKTTPADPMPYDITEGLDPREVIAELGRILPEDAEIVGGSGQQGQFYVHMSGRPQRRYHDIKAFGTIGSGLSWAAGIAAARDAGTVVLVEGDGSLLMHIQELESIMRHRLKLLVCVMNDGAYGSELHKLRAAGIDDSGSVFGRPDFASIAKGFGLRGRTITNLLGLSDYYREFRAGDRAEIWDIHVSDIVVSSHIRRAIDKNYRKP